MGKSIGEVRAPTGKSIGDVRAPTGKSVGSNFVRYSEPTDSTVGRETLQNRRIHPSEGKPSRTDGFTRRKKH